MKKIGNMTHKEAVRNALEMLGGRAHTQQIYPIAIKLIGNNTKSKNIKATIRRELNSSPYAFKPTPGKEGYWELIEFQEEIVERDKLIADLKSQLAAKDEELKTIKTEDAFMKRFVKAVKHLLKREEKVVDEIRKLLVFLGRNKEEEELDAWLQGKDRKNPDGNVMVQGDYVVSKHVENEIDNVEAGGTGVNINKEEH
jgi:hypothetical protein